MKFGEIVDIGSAESSEGTGSGTGSGRGKTIDVQSEGSFDHMLIRAETVKRLRDHGYNRPSPVQLKAVPIGLTGIDMLVQAKSGTGKTLVFSILAIEHLILETRLPQKMIIAPTREIAGQIKETVRKLVPHGTRIGLFVGGVAASEDFAFIKKGVHIVIGTVGRLTDLVKKERLDLSHVDFFAMDEADHMMNESFVQDVNYLFSSLPPTRQVCVFSATYPHGLDETLSNYMKGPILVRFNADDVQLVGIKQYVIAKFDTPIDLLCKLLRGTQFVQALVFTTTVEECTPLTEQLVAAGFEADHISAQLSQRERDAVIEKLKSNKLKILVSTDLTARGVDAENVDLVVNVGVPIDVETYFHRIGRAARYGGYGAAVTLLYESKQISRFKGMVGSSQAEIKVRIAHLEDLPPDLTVNQAFWQISEPFTIKARFTKANSYESNKENENIRQKRTDSQKRSAYSPEIMEPQYSYTRQLMFSIANEEAPKPSAELANRLQDLGLSRLSTFEQQLDSLVNMAGKQKSEKNATEIAPQKVEESKKYKFVPMRKQAKKKFYMRGEMMAIRDSLSAEQWKKCASAKYNLEEEPFVNAALFVEKREKEMAKEKEQQKVEEMIKQEVAAGRQEVNQSWERAWNALRRASQDSTKSRESSTPKEETSISKTLSKEMHDLSVKRHEQKCLRKDGVMRYSRKQMYKVMKLYSKEVWLNYAKRKWDICQEPFVTDTRMRVPFHEQLRVQRQIDKEQRRKVMKDRETQINTRNVLQSSGTKAKVFTITEPTLHLYGLRLRQEYREWKKDREENPSAIRQGPVVPLRRSPAAYEAHINRLGDWLNSLDARFDYELRKKNESLKELYMQTEQTFETNREKSNEDEKDKQIAKMQEELNRLRMKVGCLEESNSRIKVESGKRKEERPKNVLQLKEGQRVENAGLEMRQADEEIGDMDEIEDEQFDESELYEDVEEDSVGLEEEDEDEEVDAETGFEQAIAWNAYLNLMLPFPNPNKQ